MATENYRKYEKLIFFILFISGVALLIWKIPYGWGAYDEPYYSAMALRFIHGDRPGIDEWNVGQWSAILLIPFISAYTGLTGSTDAVVLFCRSLFVVFQTGTSLCIVRILYRKYHAAAYAAGLAFLLYVPFNIMAPSYDSMGLQCLTLALLILYSKWNTGSRWLIIGGMLFAIAVVCNPLLVLIFIVLVILCMIRKMKIKDFLLYFSGIAVIALIYLSALLYMSDIFMIIRNIPYLTKDSQHGSTTVPEIAATVIVKAFSGFTPWIYIWLLLLLISLFDKRRCKHSVIYMSIMLISDLCCLAGFCLSVRTNYHMFPLFVTGLEAYILSEKRDRRLFDIVFCGGAAYGVLLTLASNQELDIFIMGTVVSDMASVMFIYNYLNEKRDTMYRAAVLAAVAAIAAQLLTETVSFSRNVFWEADRIENLDHVIPAGPLKGARTTEKKADDYMTALNDLSSYRNMAFGRILIADLNTWQYTYTGLPCASYAIWLGEKNEATIDKLKLYYSIYPENEPKYIYISKIEDTVWDAALWKKYADENGYSYSESSISIKMEKK